MKKKYTYFIVIFLIVVSCAAFGRIAGNEFINYDDPVYITENYQIQQGINPQTIKWAFTTVHHSYWIPLTWLSHMLDWSMFTDSARGHHIISLLLHMGSVLLLFFFLNKTTKNIWSSAFVAALFSLHPLRVESVAWASERKDVLSLFFGMASIYVYALYVENYKLSRYFFCLILFALSLMAKPMMVTLSFVLLLLDYWPLGRWQKDLTPMNAPVLVHEKPGKGKKKQRKADSIEDKKISTTIKSRSHSTISLLWEKAPFIVLTIISSIVTLWAQRKIGAVVSMEEMPFTARVLNAIISYVSYLRKTFWPVDLAVFYPYELFTLWQIWASCLILIGITIVVIYTIRKMPFLVVGWFWYLGTLIPVIGLVQVGNQAMADRYTYLPSIGIAIMLAWGIPLLFQSENVRKKILFPAGIAVLAIMTVLTWRQCGYWKNSIELWNHTLKVTNDNYLAYCNRGNAYSKLGQYQLAIEDLSKAISLKPYYDTAYYDRGTIYGVLGQYQLAIDDLNKAIGLKPDYAKAYCNRGNTYSYLGQYQMAVEDYNKAILLKPDFADAYNSRGLAFTYLGQYQIAVEDYNKAILLKPDFSDAYYNWGLAYAKLGHYQRAIEKYTEAIYLKPNYANAYNNRAVAYLVQGNKELGCRDAQKTCELGNCRLLEAAKSKGYCH